MRRGTGSLPTDLNTDMVIGAIRSIVVTLSSLRQNKTMMGACESAVTFPTYGTPGNGI